MRPRASLLVVCLALALGLAAATTSVASAAVAMPPELASLAQASLSLKINSIRFRASVEAQIDVSAPQAGGSSKSSTLLPFALFVDASGVASVAPRRAKLRIDALGGLGEERILGNASYYHRPAGSSILGRQRNPWVLGKLAPAPAVSEPIPLLTGIVSSLGGAGQGSAGATGALFTNLSELLEHAQSITDVGPEYVYGQQTDEFEMQLEPSTLGGTLAAGLEGLHTKLPGKPQATERLALFFAPDGLPLRTNWTIDAGQLSLSTSIDVLATEVPVDVKAPPAADTITAAKLARQEAAERRQQRRVTRRSRIGTRRLARCIKRAHGDRASVQKCFASQGRAG